MPEQDLDGVVLAITGRLHPDLARMHHDLLSRCCSGHLRSARRRDVVLERTYASRLSGMG
jgi:hypothetical protein